VKCYLVDASAEPSLAALRFRLKDARFFSAEKTFEAAGQKFAAGAFLLPVEGNPADLDLKLNSAARELGVRVTSAASVPEVERHEVGLPRIALLHTWERTQNEGWFRLALEESGVPYTYLADTALRTIPNLKEKFDVIVYPSGASDVSGMLNGFPKRIQPDGSEYGGALAWQNSATTPNLGGVDEAADIRGGLGFEGVANLRKFVEDGGLFVLVAASVRLPVELGITDTVSVAETHQLQARGSILRANVEDKASPIAYGYDESLGVYFNQAPVLHISLPGGSFDEGEHAQRPSGRGSTTDPDIPQGRPWTPPEPAPHRSRAEQETYIDPQVRSFVGAFLPPESLYPRVILRFADEKDLWISGMLAGGSELAGSPAVVDVPVGRGHVVLFATNPMWRQETQGSFMLLLNAALNFDHLNVGRKPSTPSAAAKD
jgi:hypothetical protein